MKFVAPTLTKIKSLLKTNVITWFAVALTVFSILKGLEFFAIISLIFIWIRNDDEMGIRLQKLFVKIGKEGAVFRDPPEETAVEKQPTILLKESAQYDDLKQFYEANSLLFNGDLKGAKNKYLSLIEKTKDHSIKIDSFINLGATYMRLWHESANQEYLDKSIESSRQALRLDQDGYRSRLNLAVALSKDRRTEIEALKYFEEADQKGDLRDPILWGKIKLFKASLILTLSNRPNGVPFKKRLHEAELDIIEAMRLFGMKKNNIEVPWLLDEAKTSLNLIKRKIALL